MCKTDFAEKRFGKASYFHSVWNAPEDQSRKDSDSKTAFHHGHNSIVIPCGESDVRLYLMSLQQFGYFRLSSVFQQHKRLPIQIVWIKPLLLRQRMIHREHRCVFIHSNRYSFELSLCWESKEAAINAAFKNPLFYFPIIPQQQLKPDSKQSAWYRSLDSPLLIP